MLRNGSQSFITPGDGRQKLRRPDPATTRHRRCVDRFSADEIDSVTQLFHGLSFPASQARVGYVVGHGNLGSVIGRC
ncbi:hypothetical protein LMTR3_14165 [Bradyrhizobium sp. LMTR 3]|nr:hypothetical protein LMTR3_14165 [Bradyrhizobium sp. LMTR 3]